MIENHDLICEIFFSDHKSGVLTSLIGHIDANQLIHFSNGGEEFIKFKEKYHPPIYVPDVKEILIYRASNESFIEENLIGLNKYIRKNSKVKVS
jgi:hypothetical protein